jgi:hypothetical protein
MPKAKNLASYSNAIKNDPVLQGALQLKGKAGAFKANIEALVEHAKVLAPKPTDILEVINIFCLNHHHSWKIKLSHLRKLKMSPGTSELEFAVWTLQVCRDYLHLAL